MAAGEILLFSKAKSPRPKGRIDFDAALPLLSAAQRRWPADAITTTQGSHLWLSKLAGNDISRFFEGQARLIPVELRAFCRGGIVRITEPFPPRQERT